MTPCASPPSKASAGSCNLLLAWMLGQAQWPTPQVLAAAAFIGTLGYGFSLAAFVSALRYLGTARTGAYFSLGPFAGASLSLLLFHEPISARFIGAALCTAAGVYLHLTEDNEHEHTHDEHHQHEHEPGQSSQQSHTHRHRHIRMSHKHPHYPDIHHRHEH